MSGAGDVNGDGVSDIVVGAPKAEPNGVFWAGRSYVVFGKADTDPVLLADVAAGIGGFAMDGVTANDEAGCSVGGAWGAALSRHGTACAHSPIWV